MEKNQWWGYLHTSGSLHVKRYFDRRDIDEALESPFVDTVIGPFDAADRNEAISTLEIELKKAGALH